ncbi:hypothetical protein MHU86_7605 [Fragilaria crotonensis]|nr:hypothetical protein MHU86_7605 [Fragilaria crotonensis]
MSLPGSELIVVVVGEEHGEEDMLATVVSGLVCWVVSSSWRLITIPLLSSEVALRGPYLPGSRRGQTMSSSRQGGVGGCGKGSNKVVQENGATGNLTLPTAMSVWNLGQLPRDLGSLAILDGGRNCLPSRRGWDERESSESLVSYVAVVHGCCTGRKGMRSGNGSNVQRRLVRGSAGRLVNSWVVGCRSVWLQLHSGVSPSDWGQL